MEIINDQQQCILKRLTDGGGEIAEDVYAKLPALDGQTIIVRASDVFSQINSLFKEFGLMNCGVATKKTEFGVYEVLSHSDMFDIFNKLSGDINDKVFSQHQIVEASRKFYRLFPPGITPAIFFCKKDEKLILNEQNYKENVFAIHVYNRPFADSTGLYVVPIELLDEDVFGSSGNHPRVFKPYGVAR